MFHRITMLSTSPSRQLVFLPFLVVLAQLTLLSIVEGAGGAMTALLPEIALVIEAGEQKEGFGDAPVGGDGVASRAVAGNVLRGHGYTLTNAPLVLTGNTAVHVHLHYHHWT